MLRTRIIPTLLLDDGGLVKTVKFKNPSYVGDPINAVRIFNDKGADELVLLDISARANGGPNFRMIKEIVTEAFIPLGYGGGVTNLEQVRELFRLGVEKVVLNSAVATSLALVTSAAAEFGSQSIVVSVDVKKNLFGSYRRVVNSGALDTGEHPVAFARRAQEAGAGELFLNSVDRDGTMSGYDVDLINRVAREVTVPVVACGGAAGVGDLKAAIDAGASSAAAGSMFVFYGRHKAVLITYPDLESLWVTTSGTPTSGGK
jgi:cyclase